MTKNGFANSSFAVAQRRPDPVPDSTAGDSTPLPRERCIHQTVTGSSDPVFSLTPINDRHTLGRTWRALEERCTPSLFQSWGWIDTWLGILPPDIEPLVLTARRADVVCGLGILCRSRRRRHGWLGSTGLFLSETGVPTLDALTVEYNGVLCGGSDKADLTAGVISFLIEDVGGWDELCLSGVDDSAIAAAEAAGLWVTVTGRQPCHFVDLATIRDRQSAYLDGLSRNTRSQVRRAVRRYEERGRISIRVAETAEQARADFDDMKVLHQAYWESRGQPGAFANPVFEDFHRAFIGARFSAGEIEMLRVAVDDRSIGYLYNIVHRRHVYSYQSGFAYEQDNSMKPGLVSHYLAIERNLSRDAAIYDFMAGGGQHKRSLGTACGEMVWLRAARPRLKFRAEAFLRSLKQKLRPPPTD